MLLLLAALCVNINSVTPSAGHAGTQVTITGSGFTSCCPFECTAPQVTFGNTPANVVSVSDTQLVAIVPNAPGATTVTVSQLSGSATAAFAVIAEVPALGSTALAFAALMLIALALFRLR